MRNRIRQFGLTVSLGIAGMLLAPAISAAQNRNFGPTRKAGTPVAPGAVAERTAADYLAFETERFRPHLRVEYHFLRAVCSLTPEQRTRIARGAEREYKETVAQYVKLTWSPQFRRAGEAPRFFPDPRKLIREGLARAAEPHLNSEQAARYHQEIAQRAEAQRQMVIKCYVLSLDQALILSAEQRCRIAERLTADWDEAWFPSESMLLDVDSYVSRIPRQQVLPLLSEEQKRVWDPTHFQKSAVPVMIQPFPAIPVDFPEDEELTEARGAEAKGTEGPP
jgi:hypothetical protein